MEILDMENARRWKEMPDDHASAHPARGKDEQNHVFRQCFLSMPEHLLEARPFPALPCELQRTQVCLHGVCFSGDRLENLL